MSVTLWIDTAKDSALELGQTFACYEAFAEMARAAGESWADYPDLAGVLTQCETQEDADPEWLAAARGQAAAFLKRHGGGLGRDARNLLANLAGGEPA